jgi:hypothetical protein
LVVAGLVVPNKVSMPLTVHAGATDPGRDPSRAEPMVTGSGAATGTGTVAVFGTVGVDDDLAVGPVRFTLTPTADPEGAVEWTLDGPTHYRVEAPVAAVEYQLTVTATVDGEEHTEQASVILEPGRPLEVSTLVSSAPWLVFFLPVPAY